jgi:hypothetical protein
MPRQSYRLQGILRIFCFLTSSDLLLNHVNKARKAAFLISTTNVPRLEQLGHETFSHLNESLFSQDRFQLSAAIRNLFPTVSQVPENADDDLPETALSSHSAAACGTSNNAR